MSTAYGAGPLARVLRFSTHGRPEDVPRGRAAAQASGVRRLQVDP